MNAVRVHGILLIVAMLVAFQTYTRDNSRTAADAELVTVWEYDPADITSVTYETPARTLTLERRVGAEGQIGAGESYVWGIAVPKAAAMDSGLVGPAAKREEFPVGEEGDRLLERLAALQAIRDLGILNDEAKGEYELTSPERSLTVRFLDGEKRIELGAAVFGSPDRYAMEPATSEGYVIGNDNIRGLEGGPATLQARALHRYENTRVTGVSLRTQSGERQMLRGMDGPLPVWSRPDAPGESDQTFANFMERVDQLTILTYDSGLRLDTLQFVVRIDYVGEGGAPIGFLEMFRAPPDADGAVEYYVRTEATRVPARVYRGLGERVDQDLEDVL